MIGTANHPKVAPHVGAWIETDVTSLEYEHSTVAPHVGAWIETNDFLKSIRLLYVAPHVGAWIETDVSKNTYHIQLSHPMWVRGLKQTDRRFSML